MVARPLDSLLDFTVVPGFTSAGYRLRQARLRAGAGPDRPQRSSSPAPARGWAPPPASCSAEAGAHGPHAGPQPGKGRGRPRRDRRPHRQPAGCASGSATSRGPARSASSRAAFTAEVRQLDALVNNAGVMAPERTHTPEGVELTFATNVRRAVPADRAAPARAARRGAGPRRERLVGRHVHGAARRRRPAARAARVRPRPLLRPHEALRGGADRALAGAPGGQRGHRPLDAPRLGRHAGRPGVAAALSQA